MCFMSKCCVLFRLFSHILACNSFLPGQEAGNVQVVLDAGFGDFNKKSSQIAYEVACWLKNPELLNFMSSKTKDIGQPSAASDIVEDIGEITHTWMRLNGERKSTLILK